MPTLLTSIVMMPLLAAATAGDARFEAPVEIKADGKAYSAVPYPSPVAHDLDGDGTFELIIGDLRGRLQSAARLSPGDPTGWGPSVMLKGSDGKDLKFSNW